MARPSSSSMRRPRCFLVFGALIGTGALQSSSPQRRLLPGRADNQAQNIIRGDAPIAAESSSIGTPARLAAEGIDASAAFAETVGKDLLPLSFERGERVDYGETQQVEFKSCAHGDPLRVVRDKTAKYIVAFTNTYGGALMFGIEDDGNVTGCALDAAQRTHATKIIDGATQRVDPQLDYNAVSHHFIPVSEDLYVLVVLVKRGVCEPVYYVGGDSMECWIRRAESVFMMSRELQQARELEFKMKGHVKATRTWRHVAARELGFDEHVRGLRRASRYGGERRWFWRALSRWFDTDAEPKGQLILVMGKAGSGKSTLMAAFLANKKGGRRHRPVVSIIGAHFCMSFAPETTSVDLFVHNFAAPLLRLSYFKTQIAVPHAEEVLRITEQPDKVSAMRSLLAMCTDLALEDVGRKRAFVVDGLDEALSSDSSDLTIPRLLALTAADAPSWLVFVATTRRLEDGDDLGTAPREQIDLDGGLSRLDVADYVRRRLKYAGPQEELEETYSKEESEFGRRVGDASCGSFQFAKAVLDLVDENAVSTDDLSSLLLTNSQQPLDRLYEAIFRAKFSDNEEDWEEGYRPLLELLLVAPRPFAQDEVETALRHFHPNFDMSRQKIGDFLRPLLISNAEKKLALHLTLRQWLVKNDAYRCSEPRGHALMAMHHLGALRSMELRRHFFSPQQRNDEVVFHVLEAAQHLAEGDYVSDKARSLRELAGPLRADGQGRTPVHFAAKQTRRVAALRSRGWDS